MKKELMNYIEENISDFRIIKNILRRMDHLMDKINDDSISDDELEDSSLGYLDEQEILHDLLEDRYLPHMYVHDVGMETVDIYIHKGCDVGMVDGEYLGTITISCKDITLNTLNGKPDTIS